MGKKITTTHHFLSKTPRVIIYALAVIGILVLVAAIIGELIDPGSIQRIREATEVVFAEAGLVIAAIVAIAAPVLALLNLTDDGVTSSGDVYLTEVHNPKPQSSGIEYDEDSDSLVIRPSSNEDDGKQPA